VSLQVEKRINDRSIINVIHELSERRCEYVDPLTGLRCNNYVDGEPHHIKTRGAGGDDIQENQIDLCGEHHTKAHTGEIKRQTLIQIVADREGMTYDEICKKIRLHPKEYLTNNEATSTNNNTVQSDQPNVTDLINAYIQLDEQENDSRWLKGQLLDSMLNAGAKQSWLAHQLRVSAAQIRELCKVYRAFPDEGMRIPLLNWYHHRVAANSPDPQKYIVMAADQELSTREMRKVILEQEGGIEHDKQEQTKEQKKAEKLFLDLEKVIASGGEASKWLKKKLAEILGCDVKVA